MADDTGRGMMTVGGTVQAIVPRSFEEAWRVAGALAASGLAPKDINTQEKCLVIIMAGAEIGMAPFQALQSFAVINGRPALYGDGMMAVARKHGVRVEESIEGTGDAMVASCTVKRPDTGEAITRAFSVADARKAGLWGKAGPWSQYPQRMLGMRARSFALRDGCADLLRGMKMVEEVQDYTEVTHSERVPINEYDQRPPEEIAEAAESGGAFIMGEAWGLVEGHYTKLFADAPDEEALDKIWKSFNRKYWVGVRRCISHNSRDGLEHLYEQNKARFETSDGVWIKLESALAGFVELGALEEWRADASTDIRYSKLTPEKQAAFDALYEDVQERLADALQAEIAEQRKQAAAAP